MFFLLAALDVLLEGTNNCNVRARRVVFVVFFSVGNFKLCGKKSCYSLFFCMDTFVAIGSNSSIRDKD